MAKITLDLDVKEYEMLIAAVRICVPTGGGSAQWVLYNKLVEQLGIEASMDDMRYLDSIVIDEWKEANDMN